MNDPSLFDPEDPRLTAYALGELTDPDERAAVEDVLQRSPEARTTLREIRELTAALSAEYEEERRLASEENAPGPERLVNVVAMAPAEGMERRAWPRRLLLAAALVVLTAAVARMWVGERAAKPGVAATDSLHSLPKVASAGTRVAANAPAAPADRVEAAAQPTTPPLLAMAAPKDAPQAQILPLPTAGSGGELVQEKLAASAKPEVSPYTGSFSLAQSAPVAAAAPAVDASSSLNAMGGGMTARSPTATRLIQRNPTNAEGMDMRSAPPSESYQALPARAKKAERADSDRLKPNGIPAEAAARRRALIAGSAAPLPEPQSASMLPPAAPSTVALLDGQTSADSDKTRDNIESRMALRKRDTAVYEHRVENPFLGAKENPLSTFSIDVDTASYANVRRFIDSGSLPPVDAVRIEEMVNYFPYSYAPPAPGEERPFAVHLEVASCPWNPQDRLVRIGIKGREMAKEKRPPSNLVFLLDVSGSMAPPERLPLIKASMRLLVEQLREDDRVSIVTYAGESGVVLPPTTGDHKESILRALEEMHAGGSTNGASGIKLAYKVAREGFIKGGTNRVILATDGDFNVGVTNQKELVSMVEREAKSGVALSALGVGTDNYKDATMQKLADKGNGNYAYIDRLDEARKVLVEQMSGTLVTLAKDVKIQVEFNPTTVAAYRLIGYEKRMLRKEDFNDDRIDAGEIGAGHSVTALYEIVPAGGSVPGVAPAVDALKYGNVSPAPSAAVEATPAAARSGELLTVKMRHKTPDGDKSERSYEEALVDHGAPGDFAKASADFKFAAAVATFGMALRDPPGAGGVTLGAAIELAQEGVGADPGGYRAGFIELARRAQALQAGRGE